MKRTSHPKDEPGLINWFHAHKESRKVARFIVRPPEVWNFIHVLWPSTPEYYSPLNAVFLCDIISLELMARQPTWFIRDGLVPLLWFFRANPSPKVFKGKIYVHEDMAPYVPPAWRKNAGTYRLASLPEAAKAPLQQVFLVGLAMDSYCSLKHLKEMLGEARKAFPKGKLKVNAFVPMRHDGMTHDRQHGFHGSFVMEMAKNFGTEIEFLSWTQIENMENLLGSVVIDMNEGLLCADSYMVHEFMRRGARYYDPTARRDGKPSGELVELSRYHGVTVKEGITAPYALEKARGDVLAASKFQERMREAMQSEANHRYPWPNWFAEFTNESSRARWS